MQSLIKAYGPLFVGLEAYEATGGAVLRDLFSEASITRLNGNDLIPEREKKAACPTP